MTSGGIRVRIKNNLIEKYNYHSVALLTTKHFFANKAKILTDIPINILFKVVYYVSN